MLRKRFSYQELEKFARKEAEWITFEFRRGDTVCLIIMKDRMEKALKEGKVEIQGWDYTAEEMENLLDESEGVVHEFKFEIGGNEGYKFTIRTDSGQIIYIKTFELEFYERINDWFKQWSK